VTSEQATTRAYFNGDVDIKRIKNANLMTVVPGGNKGKNTLYFNSKSWEGIYKGVPYDDLAIDIRDVSGYFLPDNNEIRIQDKGDYLVPSNEFLILKFSEASIDQGSGTQKTPGFDAALSLVSILAILSILKCEKKQKEVK
jgi:hypothetical protein